MMKILFLNLFALVAGATEPIHPVPALCTDYLALKGFADLVLRYEKAGVDHTLDVVNDCYDLGGGGICLYQNATEKQLIDEVFDQPKKIIQFITFLLDINGIEETVSTPFTQKWGSHYKNLIGHHTSGDYYRPELKQQQLDAYTKDLFIKYENRFIAKTGKRLYLTNEESYRLFLLAAQSINLVAGKNAFCKAGGKVKVDQQKNASTMTPDPLPQMALNSRTLIKYDPFRDAGLYCSGFLFRHLFENNLKLATEVSERILLGKNNISPFRFEDFEGYLIERAIQIAIQFKKEEIFNLTLDQIESLK